MQHTFASNEGPVEVTLSKQGDAYTLEGHMLVEDTRGRLRIRLENGETHLAHVAKVGDVWWVHLNGRTYRWERIEPGSSGAAPGTRGNRGHPCSSLYESSDPPPAMIGHRC